MTCRHCLRRCSGLEEVATYRGFEVSVRQGESRSEIACSGELDVFTAPRLREAVDECLERSPTSLAVDATEIQLLTSTGIEVFLYALARCYALGIPVDMTFSARARRILDLAGLWWVGIIDDGFAAELAMRSS